MKKSKLQKIETNSIFAMKNILFLLVLIIIACFTIYESYHFINLNEESKRCDNIYNPCAEGLLKEAAYKNVVVLSAVSKKYMIQIKNFWLSSSIPNHLTNIVFVASDYVTFNYCKSFTKYVLMGNVIINQTKEITFLNKDFLKITLSRLEMIYRILALGLSVLVADLDIYFYKNPIPFLFEYKEDIVTSIDRPGVINVGFYLIKSNKGTIKFYNHLITKAKQQKNSNLFEQSYIQEELKKFKKEITLKELPLNQFPSGCEFFGEKCNLYYDEIDKNNDVIMVHFNCITTFFAGKILKQKDLLMFNVDDDNYYSSTTNKYIKINFNNNSSDINYDRKVVMFGFALAMKTNRIFIFPKFSCSKSLILKKHYNRNCSYDDLFDIVSLDKYLINSYRENQFLYNKLVPDVIKTSQKAVSIEKVKSLEDTVDLVNKEDYKVVILNIGSLECECHIEDRNIVNGVKIRESW